jgi:pimeloyl-ACP methyl ester carboxylesterase
MDHLGMGRSDKPIDIKSYSYLGHFDRLERFIRALDLSDINLFVQDWGSLLGLRVAGLNPSWFARIAVGNGILPVIPAGFQPFPPVENPDKAEEIKAPFNSLPAQQFPFYDGCNLLIPRKDNSYFGRWMTYAMKAESFHPAEVLEAMTWFELPADVEAAYDAPFPKRIYMAGVRVFPSLVNELPGMNEKAWSGLTSFERPFLALWASNDPGVQGSCEAQQYLVDNIPGAAGQPHDRLAEASHFLQEDQGEEIARRLVEFYSIGSDYQSTSYTAEKSSPLAGHWLSAETADEKKQRQQAIDEATDGLGRFMRGRARDRLFERTTPPKNLVIEIEGSKVTIVSGDGRLELEAGGAPIEVSGSDGKAQISAKIKGPQLIVAAITSKAERTIIYNTKEQNLLVEVTMKVAELSKPLKYVSTYSRVE